METSSLLGSRRKEIDRKPLSDLTNVATPPLSTVKSSRKPIAQPRGDLSLTPKEPYPASASSGTPRRWDPQIPSDHTLHPAASRNSKGKAPISDVTPRRESSASGRSFWQRALTRKDKEKEVDIGSQSSCPSGDLSPQCVPTGKDKGKEVAVASQSSRLSRSLSQQSVPTRKDKGKEVSIVSLSSCPPVGRFRRNREKLEMEEESNGLKACSAPNPRHKKRQRCTAAESRAQEAQFKDFIEKQRAYFSEIDAFELVEEFASDGNSD